MNFINDVKKNYKLLIMALPVVIYFIMFNYMPMVGLQIAFKNFNYRAGIFGSDWVGLKNFEFLFKSGDIYMLIRNTVGYNIVFIIAEKALSVFLAILFDTLGKSKLNRFNQTVVILPHFLSAVVIGYFVYSFLNFDKGILNKIVSLLGGENINWYSEAKYWPVILFLIRMWMTLGWGSIVYYSSIKGFETSYYEAAKIDGATWWQQVTNITLPLLKPTIIVMVILSLGSIFHSDFGLFYIIPRNSGALYDTTSTIDTYVYNGLLKGGNIGMTSATSFIQSIVGFILVVTVNSIIKKMSPEDSMF